MAKRNNNGRAVNVVHNSVVGIQSPGDVHNTVVVNGVTQPSNEGGRWLDDPDDMDRSLIRHADDLD